MQIKSVIIPIFIVIIFLTTGFLTVLAQGPDAISLIDSVDQINAANTGKPLTERMAVVMLPEDDNEDMNYNRIEDQFEPDLAGLSDTDFVEAIIRTEFRIDDEFETYLKSAGAEIVYVAHGVESAGVRITKGDLMMLSRNPLIVRIYKNHEVVSTLDTSVPVINAGSSKLTAAGYGDLDGSGVTITVIDSGVDGSHRTFPDGKIIAFKDYNGGRDDLDPTNGMSTYDSTQQPHGTMCASVAAGTGGGTKYVGSAPGAYLIVIRVGGSSFDIANAVQWCINNKNTDFNKDGVPDGPDLITMSLGTSPNNYMDQVCTQAVTAGITFLTSAGNSGPGSSTMTSPARAKEMIAVGAIHDNKNVWYYSSRGPGANGITKPDIMAPGVQVTVAYPGNNWIVTSGTSFSSPMAAGATALLLQLRPDLTPGEVMEILHDTAEDKGSSGPDNAYGWGVMDTIAALNKLPTIRELTISSKEVQEDEEITFKAVTTGNILRYEWDFDGDGTYDHSSFDSADVKHTYTESGFYEVTFRITDAEDETQTETDLIVVENVKPELDVLYASGSLNEDEALTFNVSGTSDTPTDYIELDYSWDFGDGTILDTRETEVAHAYKNQGAYDVKVTVEDDDGVKDTETIQIFVSNILPVADAGAAGRDAKEDDRLFFSGADSYDTPSDMAVLNYTWDMGDGSVIYQKEFYYTYTEAKTYSIALIVKDDNGGQDKSIIRATVKNVKPAVDIKELAEKRIVLEEDEEITLHGLVNDTKSDLDFLEYSWDFDDGSEYDWDNDNLIVDHSFTGDGSYAVKFKARDDDGSVNFTTITVEVENVPPVATFSSSSTTIWEDEVVYFDSGGTSDTLNDLKNLQYNWDFDDGDTAMGKNVEHTFRRAGIFQVILTVVDDDQEESIFTEYVTVRNVEPKAMISASQELAFVGDVINFSGKSSWDSPSDFHRLVYQWDFGDENSDTGMEAQHAYTAPGEYETVLTVIDDDGSFHTETVTIVVKERSSGTIGEAFDLQSTDGQLILVTIILVLILVLIVIFAVVSNNRRKKARIKRMGYSADGRSRKAVMKRRRKKQALPADFNQMVAQQQMADYGLASGQFGQQYPLYNSQEAYPQQGQPQQPQLPQQGMSGYQQPVNGYDAYGQPVTAEPQYQQPPALPPVYNGEPVTAPLEQQQPVYDAEVVGIPGYPVGSEPVAGEPIAEGPVADNRQKFCGNCGTESRPNWFICPNCKEML